MTGIEKRRMFKQSFGELLLPHGFFLKNGMFYRIGDDVLQKVSLYLLRGHFSVRWEAKPFCIGLNSSWMEWFKTEGQEQIEPFMMLNRDIDFNRWYDVPEEEQFTLMYNAFIRMIFEAFNKIHTVSDFLDYQNWCLHTYFGGEKSERYEVLKALECIYLKRYGDAIKYLERYIDRINSTDGAISDRMNGGILYYKNMIELMKSNDTKSLDEMVFADVQLAREACKTYFGKKWTEQHTANGMQGLLLPNDK